MFFALNYLDNYGEGLMATERYGNMMLPNFSGIIQIFKTVITNLGYTFTQILNIDKIPFIIYIMLPIGACSIATKKYERYLLFIPLVFFNLITQWGPQYDIHYQYAFGSQMFLVYCFILNIKDLETSALKRILPICTLIVFIASASVVIPIKSSIAYYNNNRIQIKELNKACKTIPENASVQASSLLVPKLSKRDQIYMLMNDNKYLINDFEEPDYVMIDLRTNTNASNDSDYINEFLNKGYSILQKQSDLYVILKKTKENTPYE